MSDKEKKSSKGNVLSIKITTADVNSMMVSYHPILGTFFHFGAGATAHALVVLQNLIENGSVPEETSIGKLEQTVGEMLKDVSMLTQAKKEINGKLN